MNSYYTYNSTERWYKLLELFTSNSSSSSSKHQYLETHKQQEEPLS